MLLRLAEIEMYKLKLTESVKVTNSVSDKLLWLCELCKLSCAKKADQDFYDTEDKYVYEKLSPDLHSTFCLLETFSANHIAQGCVVSKTAQDILVSKYTEKLKEIAAKLNIEWEL